MTAIFIGQLFNEQPFSRYDEIFNTTEDEEEYTDNALVKELFLDYAERWNKIKRGEK